MPVIIEWTFSDSSKETDRLAVQIWRKNENRFSRVFVKNKEVVSIKLDPMRETADINEANNTWPVVEIPSRFQLFKSQNAPRQPGRNAMQKEIID
jgi:tRNA U34 5-methylaminomethyl-2-thiouridine-forming methyltransferase MnmC